VRETNAGGEARHASADDDGVVHEGRGVSCEERVDTELRSRSPILAPRLYFTPFAARCLSSAVRGT
jgi:hypothetical protein